LIAKKLNAHVCALRQAQGERWQSERNANSIPQIWNRSSALVCRPNLVTPAQTGVHALDSGHRLSPTRRIASIKNGISANPEPIGIINPDDMLGTYPRSWADR
jgi:hypothetical protein